MKCATCSATADAPPPTSTAATVMSGPEDWAVITVYAPRRPIGSRRYCPACWARIERALTPDVGEPVAAGT